MNMNNNKKHLLIACTGSVASIKIGELVRRFKDEQSFEFEVKIVSTNSAMHFITRSDEALSAPVLTDSDEWNQWSQRDDPVLHIELTKWADIMVIAPLDANTLAKMASGVCDNLVLCITRAWDFDKPIFFCPAMNTRMWDHPITAQHIQTLKSWGYHEIKCIAKKLMCGDTGFGAMETPTNITQTIVNHLSQLDRLK